MRIAISNYKSGEEIWRGEVDDHTWAKYLRVADTATGAAPSSIFFDQGLLTGQKVPETIYAEALETSQGSDREAHRIIYHGPAVGEPVFLQNGTWALVESVYAAAIYLRMLDGSLLAVPINRFKTRRGPFPNILSEVVL